MNNLQRILKAVKESDECKCHGDPHYIGIDIRDHSGQYVTLSCDEGSYTSIHPEYLDKATIKGNEFHCTNYDHGDYKITLFKNGQPLNI